MPPSGRRTSNGRSPLVNQQRQITSFFSRKTLLSSSPSPSPSPPSATPKLTLKNHSPPTDSDTCPSSTPLTPSPLDTRPNKPLLVIGPSSPPTPASSKKFYGPEVVDKRIRVYWPLDQSWYQGFVKGFDEISGKHLVLYDDMDEELLNLAEEKIEWPIDDVEPPVRRRRRIRPLRRISIVEDDEECDHVEKDGADSGRNTASETKVVEDVPAGMDLEEHHEGVCSVKLSSGRSNKRKMNGEEKLVSYFSKKIKDVGVTEPNGSTISRHFVNGGKLVEPASDKVISEKGIDSCRTSVDGAPERFGAREATKLYFLTEDRRDANRRRPGHEDYDPKTLFLPLEFLKGLSSGQRQWWDFKSKHMDKVLFFKMGKFYELFEMDAHVGAKELDLQYMKGEQPHCGFPEKNFSMNVEKLARKGYRVLVVEQTETPEQLELRRREKGSKDKVVKREICAVVTKGTLTEGEMLSANPDASYLMSVIENSQNSGNQLQRIFGVCVVDVATSKIMLGQFMDDSECSTLSFLLSELRPVEIVKPAEVLSPETERILLRHTRNPVINELRPLLEFWDAEKTIYEVNCIFQRINDQTCSSSQNGTISRATHYSDEDGGECLPDTLSELVAAGEDGSYALSALGGILFYLKNAFLDESLLRFAKFESLPCSGLDNISQKPYMVLDAAALENLEIFENSKSGDSIGTLYAQLNHCVTAFGKRLLKKWLARPLCHVELIHERQDAVAGLKGVNLPSVLEFRKELSRLPDVERLLARIFTSSEAIGRNANKVILYEDAAKKQLQEFLSALRGCEIIFHACFSLASILENVESKLLHHLLTPGKGFPDVHSVMKHFKDAFDWVEANNSGRIIPTKGADKEYDNACKSVREVESNLMEHLKEQRILLGDTSINYVTVGKDAYLLEVPESLCRSTPHEYELQSSKKGFFRYWTPVIKNLLGELSQAESEKEAKLKSILQRLVGRFSEHHDMWRRLVSTAAELDVLISISIASEYYEGQACRPIITGLSSPDAVPYLNVKGLGHPILRSDSLGKGGFVPNDVTLGGSEHASFILLTGPNMGGKSTLLRQVCLAVILAQVGADVPAQSLVMSPVDRIFVRMGARDHIMAGQSTFLTELLETASMLSLATRNSIVALDELGRGTSTSDGQAIAESVLDHFAHKVHCRGMFSTHYHRLAINYERDPKVSLCHMACQVGRGSEGLEDVAFLYRLTPGACPKSYGVNVAKLAGLPDAVLQKAASKSQDFEKTYGRNRRLKDIFSTQQKEELKNLMKNLATIEVNRSCHQTVVSILVELQQKAGVLLEQS